MIALWGDKEEWWHIDKAKEAGLSILGNSYLKIKKKKVQKTCYKIGTDENKLV
jgi:hypothetical protein